MKSSLEIIVVFQYKKMLVEVDKYNELNFLAYKMNPILKR